jgi:hypothetical protein
MDVFDQGGLSGSLDDFQGTGVFQVAAWVLGSMGQLIAFSPRTVLSGCGVAYFDAVVISIDNDEWVGEGFKDMI